jgi:casein kinase II subunit beta
MDYNITMRMPFPPALGLLLMAFHEITSLKIVEASSDYRKPSLTRYPKRSSASGNNENQSRKKKVSKPRTVRPLPKIVDDEISDFPLDLFENEDEERLLDLLDKMEREGEEEDIHLPPTNIKRRNHRVENIASEERRTPSITPISSTEDSEPNSKKQASDDQPEKSRTLPSATPSSTNDILKTSVARNSYSYYGTLRDKIAEETDEAPQPARPLSQLSVEKQQPPFVATRGSESQQASKLSAMLSYTTPWVIKFLRSRPKDALLAVPRDFLGDGFNLVNLPPIVERLVGSNDSTYPLYRSALRLILSMQEVLDSEIPPQVQRAAEVLYTLVHQRYITSPRGLDTVRRMLIQNRQVFGRCPRPSCRGMALLPYGESADYACRNSQRYCCSCGQAWEFWESKVDASAWGPSFCHLYLLTFGKAELGNHYGGMPQNPSTVPTIFGFQVHSAALRRLHEP